MQYGRRELAYRSLLLLVTGRKEEETASQGGFRKARSGVLIRRQPSHRSRSFARGKAKKPITAKPEGIIARVAGDAVVGLCPPVAADFFYVWAIMVSNSLTFWTLALQRR